MKINPQNSKYSTTFFNFRVSGLDKNTHDDQKNGVLKFADDDGIKMSPSQTVDVESLARVGDNFNPILVCFNRVQSRKKLINAK